MATTLSDLAPTLCNQLEESNPPVYWDLQNELYVALVEAMFAATCITQEPQQRASTIFTPTLNSNLQTIPSGGLAILRIEDSSGNSLLKTTMYAADCNDPTWESKTSTSVQWWMPFGLGQFILYPKLSSSQQLVVTTLQYPVNVQRPYTGSIVCPFQPEYFPAMQDMAAFILRIKEGGVDLRGALPLRQSFVQAMTEMSKYADRKNMLLKTLSFGAVSRVTERKRLQ